MDFILIDLQGFKSNNNIFIIKEICILKHNIVHHYIVKPPYNWNNLSKVEKQECIWVQQNYHGLHWNDGSITFPELKNYIYQLLKFNNSIYVKGNEKVKWVKKLIKNKKNINCINLEDIGCKINLHKYEKKNIDIPHCNQHRINRSKCAFQNVLILKDWLAMKSQST